MKNSILALIVGVMVAGCGGADSQSQLSTKAQSSTELGTAKGVTAAQGDVIKLFDAVPVTFTGKVTPGNVVPYNQRVEVPGEISVWVDCGTGGSVTIGSLDANGNIGPFIVDNYLTVNGEDVCDDNCFSGWYGPTVDWMSLGDDDAAKFGAGFFEAKHPAEEMYGTVPAKTRSYTGKQLLTFDRIDWGGVIGSTAIYMKADGCKVSEKVSIVHFANAKPLCIGAAAIPAHINHGDDINSIVIGCDK